MWLLCIIIFRSHVQFPFPDLDITILKSYKFTRGVFFIIRCGRVRLSLWTLAILLATSVPVQLAPRLIYCRAVSILLRKGVGGRD